MFKPFLGREGTEKANEFHLPSASTRAKKTDITLKNFAPTSELTPNKVAAGESAHPFTNFPIYPRISAKAFDGVGVSVNNSGR